jgi:ribosome assembly protein YihI (activator of Der GTPase)
MIAMSFNLVQEQVINNVKTLGKQLGILKDDDEEEDEQY